MFHVPQYLSQSLGRHTQLEVVRVMLILCKGRQGKAMSIKAVVPGVGNRQTTCAQDILNFMAKSSGKLWQEHI